MSSLSSRFWFCAGSPGCQDLLKHEVLSRHPELKFAFSRPGLLTFKSERDLFLAEGIESHLSTVCGLSLGGAKTQGEIAPLLRKVWPQVETDATQGASETAFQAFAWPTDEDEEPASSADLLTATEVGRRAVEGTSCQPNVAFGVLVPPPARLDYGYWIFARATNSPFPTEKVTPPPGAPSRAYSKLVEALAHFRITPGAGEMVLELGAAPGGATLALLERGLSVIAVDPAKMDPTLAPLALERGLFLCHLEKPAQALAPADLASAPSPVRWLVSDMNLAPPVAVQQLLRARALVKKTLRGAILTLKLNDTAAVDVLPRTLTELERAFGQPPRIAHLPSHRREVVAVIVQSKAHLK